MRRAIVVAAAVVAPIAAYGGAWTLPEQTGQAILSFPAALANSTARRARRGSKARSESNTA